MNPQTDSPTNAMQATEAFPLEDRSAPASEVIIEQQAELASNDVTSTFIP
jgi:hypothetical protein